MELKNVATNKRKSKKRDKNEFSLITQLVKKYKETGKDEDLVECVKQLQGIINSFTIILTPSNAYQQIHINPFMAKFLGMFLTPEERSGKVVVETYYKAIARVRWVMRRFEYEDIYSHVVSILIQTIKSMEVIGNCDCIYYIQLIARFKMHDLVMKTSRDAGMSNIADIPVNYDDPDESVEDVLDRMSFSPENSNHEDELISGLYECKDISIIVRNDDMWKCFGPYEKYLIYLHVVMGLTNRQIISILRFENNDDLIERFEDIKYKCELIAKEGD